MNLRRELRIAFAGGGTGGHFYPAVALCEKLESWCEPGGFKKLFFGTTRGIEYRQREQHQYPLVTLPVRGLVRRFLLSNLLVPWYYLRSIQIAKRALLEFKPDVVVGTGGYVSLPVLTAARQLRIPYVIQEQNSWPGLSTRKAASHAARIFTAFAEVKSHLSVRNEVIREFGNPVRLNLNSITREDARATFGFSENAKVILILGGSQGARAINQAVLRALNSKTLSADTKLLWQTGERDYTDVVAQAGEIGRTHTLFPFATEMAPLYRSADIAICRAGALTLAELEAAALPALAIPYPMAAANHQEHNARAAEKRGDLKVCLESELQHRQPVQEALAMLESGEASRMRTQMIERTNKRISATELICQEILQVIDQKAGAQS